MGLFSKPRGFDKLSDTDKLWAKKLTKKTAAAAFLDLVTQDRHDLMEYLLANYGEQIYGRIRYEAAKKACANDKAQDLRFIIENTYNQALIIYSAKNHTGLFESAAQAKSFECWQMLDRFCKGLDYTHQLPETEVVKIAAQHEWREALNHHLASASAQSGALMVAALKGAEGKSVEILKFILSWSDKFDGTADPLARALVHAAEEGSLEKADLLIAKGADPNFELCAPFRKALQKDHTDMMDFLAAHGADLQKFGRDILLQMSAPEVASAGGAYLVAMLAKEPCDTDKRFSLAAPHTLAEVLDLPSGGTLTVLFNFSTRQQILLLKDNGQIAAPQTRNFSDIENQDAIAHAAQKLLAIGGDPKAIEKPAVRNIGLGK